MNEVCSASLNVLTVNFLEVSCCCGMLVWVILKNENAVFGLFAVYSFVIPFFRYLQCLLLKFDAPTLRYSEEDPLRVFSGSAAWPCVLAAGEQPYVKFDGPLQEQRSLFTITPAEDGEIPTPETCLVTMKCLAFTHPILV